MKKRTDKQRLDWLSIRFVSKCGRAFDGSFMLSCALGVFKEKNIRQAIDAAMDKEERGK